ncbi:MAG: hypothetical protein M3162_03660 [Thermoproteota archaeon]|nr:hypothetical protein [Thermoproteota archaeon]
MSLNTPRKQKISITGIQDSIRATTFPLPCTMYGGAGVYPILPKQRKYNKKKESINFDGSF